MSKNTAGLMEVPVSYGALERASLSMLPARFAWLLCSALSAGLVVDLMGRPSQVMVWVFLSAVALGGLTEICINLTARRKLNNETFGPLFTSAKVLATSQNVAALAVLTMIVGDAVLAGVSFAQASVLGLVVGALGSACAKVPSLAMVAAPPAKAESKKAKPLTERDLELAAFHEAGHALSLAMIPDQWRQGAYVQIGDSASTFTHFPRSETLWELSVYRRWEMLMLLAGPVATDEAFGIPMEGGASDMRQWRYRAMAVLTAERAEGWVIDPTNDLEYDGNSRLLSNLESEQTEALEEFFCDNQAVYRSLAEHIRAHTGIDADTLSEYLEPVKMGPKVNAALGL